MAVASRSKGVLCAVCAASALAAPQARAGAFLAAGSSGLPAGFVMHPAGYDGSGGTLTVTLCIDPASPNAAAMEIPVRNIVTTYNSLVPTTPNLFLGASNDVPSGRVDFESVALHEVGHCIGLAHPNLASESGLGGSDTEYTRSTKGPNTTFDRDPGGDLVKGSDDDGRGDDVNLHWFRAANNNPFTLGSPVDSTTYSRTSLPGGHSFAANAERSVGALLGFPNTEAVMQQGTHFDEAQRGLAHDDVATLRYAMSGLDEVAGTVDDYVLRLEYAGQLDTCDVVVAFDDSEAAFALCTVTFGFIPSAPSHGAIIEGRAFFNTLATSGGGWFFNDVLVSQCSLDQDLLLANQVVGTTEVFEACDTITAQDFRVAAPGGDVTFRAGGGIVLGDGFVVEAGAAFTAEIDPEVGGG